MGPSGITCYGAAWRLGSACGGGGNACGGLSTTLYQANGSCLNNEYVFRSDSHCVNEILDWNAYFSFGACGIQCGSFDYNGYWTVGYLCYYSDERAKMGIKTLTNSLDSLLQLDVVEYDWNENLNKDDYEYFKRKNKLHAIGLIAQNVRQYFPEVVGIRPSGYYYVDYSKLNSVLVEAIKEQQISIEDIDEKLNIIESKIN
jgi:hypothetical protein